MFNRIGMLFLLVAVWVPPLHAQDLPPVVLEAALSAAEDALGSRPAEWRWSTLPRTRSSTLGCPLLPQDEALPTEVTPYRFNLVYSDGIYVVHVSADGTLTQLCDSKFEGLSDAPTPTDPQPDAAATCTLTTTADGVAYVVPSFDQLAMFRFVPGETLTPFGLTDNRLWYRVQKDAAVGWINVSAVQASAGCETFAPTVSIAPGGEPCFVTPIGAFVNVRARPDETSERVAIMEENTIFQALARSLDNLWIFIEPGWVSTTVTNAVGTCDGVVVNDSLIGIGSPEDVPPANTSVASALAQFACPPNFEGYLAPRITIGRGTARIADGGFPNTLRSFPTTDSLVGERLGTIQPGRTLDRVINGPACNQGFVWWYVEIDGQEGWTAESSINDDDYFIVSTDEAAAAATPLPTATPGVQQIATALPTSTPIPTAAAQTTDAPLTLMSDAAPIRAAAFNRDGTLLYVAAETPGFGDATAGVVQVWDIATQMQVNAIAVPSGLIDIAYLPQANQLVIGAGNGTLTFYDGTTLEEISMLTGLLAQAEQAGFAFSPDETQFTLTDCADELCATGLIQTYNAATGELLWQVEEAGHIPGRIVRYNPQGDLVATTGGDGVRTWQAQTGEVVSYFVHTSDVRITDMGFVTESGDQSVLVGCNLLSDTDLCESGRVELVETNTATALGQLTGIEAAVTAAVPDPTVSRGTVAQRDGVIRIISTVTGETIQTLAAPADLITDLVYAPDGVMLAATTESGQILLYTIAE